MKPLGKAYKDAEINEGFRPLPAGGYVCRILEVIDHDEEKPYLEIVFDIAEGEFTGYYSDEWGAKNTWAHRKRQYYNDASMGVFKGFLKALDESNGTNYVEMAENGLNEQLLRAAIFGLVVGLEEYNTNTGNVATRPDWFNAKVRKVSDIRQLNYTVPDLKTLAPSVPSGFAPTDDEIPFV